MNKQRTANPFFEKAGSLLKTTFSKKKDPLFAVRQKNAALLLALLLPFIFAVWHFGARVLTLVFLSCATAVLLDFLIEKCLRRSAFFARWDFSSLLCGGLLGLLYPVTAPLWLPPLGSLAAILLLRLYPLLRKKPGFSSLPPLSPTAATEFLLLLLLPGKMAVYGIAGKAGLFSSAASLVHLPNTGDPLSFLKNGALPEGMQLKDLFFGTYFGRPGCVSAVILLCCALFLLWRRDITWHIPASFAGSVALAAFLFPKVGEMDTLLLNERLDFVFGEVFGGGLLFAAIFLAASFDEAPLTPGGRLLFGFGCGGITLLLRYFTPALDGSFAAVLVMGLLRDPVERLALLLRYPASKKKQGGKMAEPIDEKKNP